MAGNPKHGERLITGLQPVREALRAHGPALGRVVVDERPLPRLDAIARYAVAQGASHVERLAKRDLDVLAQGETHQGVIAWGPPLRLVPLEPLLHEPGLVALAIDEIQDPQNFGALVRSAVGLLHAPVIWGEHSSAPLSPATFRASAGAVEHAVLCRVPSLRGSLQRASELGIQVVGLDASASLSLADVDLRGPTVLVVGSEHKGMSRGVRRSCSALARLADPSVINSLNASVAAAVALYECWKQRRVPGT